MLHVVGCSTGSMAPIGGALASARSISLVGVHPPMPITIFSPRLLIVCYSAAFSCSAAAARGHGISPAMTPKLITLPTALVVSLSVANKESWKDADGNWQSRTDWHRVVTFGKLAEYTRTLTKGSYVMVQVAVRTREYERGRIRQRITEVRADSIGKLDRAERRTESEGDPEPNDA